jgi:hypothetical protein
MLGFHWDATLCEQFGQYRRWDGATPVTFLNEDGMAGSDIDTLKMVSRWKTSVEKLTKNKMMIKPLTNNCSDTVPL